MDKIRVSGSNIDVVTMFSTVAVAAPTDLQRGIVIYIKEGLILP